MTTILVWPDIFKLNRSAFYVMSHSRGFESPLNRASLHERLAGERWMADLELVPMNNATQRELQGFLSQLDGPVTRVLLGPRTAGYASARGAGAGDPSAASVPFSDDATFSDGSAFAEGGDTGRVTALAGRGADSLLVNGLVASVTALERGDIIQVGDPWDGSNCQLLEIVQPARSDASGATRVQIRPRLRADVIAGTVVRFVDPRGLFKLADDSQTAVSRGLTHASHALRFVEALS